MELKGAVALVTGGGTGIGRAVSLSLARAGSAVAVNYASSREDAEATVRDLESNGAEAVALQADVADDAACRRLVEATIERFGRLDVLVNNAGTTRIVGLADLDGITDEVWDAVMDVNLKGTFQVSRAASGHLRRARGAIVNVGSIAGHRAAGSSLAYGASKAAIHQLTRSLALALAPEIRVNSISPGLVQTRWFRRPFGEEAVAAQEAQVAATTPLAAVTTPEHCAQAVMGLLLMDDVTGENLIVDGGLHLHYGAAPPGGGT